MPGETRRREAQTIATSIESDDFRFGVVRARLRVQQDLVTRGPRWPGTCAALGFTVVYLRDPHAGW